MINDSRQESDHPLPVQLFATIVNAANIVYQILNGFQITAKRQSQKGTLFVFRVHKIRSFVPRVLGYNAMFD